MEYRKVKSASKDVLAKGPALDKLILDTMRTISSVVGGTLGPGGQPVLIERFEHDLPVTITKDGVTVFKALGFSDPVRQCIMEAARDAAIRTATEAGDGTTTATILAEAIVSNVHTFCRENPRFSPQRVTRHIANIFRDVLEPELRRSAIKTDLVSEEGRRLLHAVATISANGDTELSDAVLRCFDVCGDEGNVTIVDGNGTSAYEVEEIEGYPVPVGYEASCMKFYPKFINEPSTARCVLDNPIFIPYLGKIVDISSLLPVFKKIIAGTDNGLSRDIVVVATGFSDQAIIEFAANFSMPGSLRVFPLAAPITAMAHGQMHFIEDICAISNSQLFDKINNPLEKIDSLNALGNVSFDEDTEQWVQSGITRFEATRSRSVITGISNEERLLARVAELKKLALDPESELDGLILRERVARLAGGIARLKVIGSSNGDTKERRDRADDAVCAVRGALKDGCAFGGGWTLLNLAYTLSGVEDTTKINDLVISKSLLAPVRRLYANCGIPSQEADGIIQKIMESIGSKGATTIVWDCLEDRMVDPLASGILDSVTSGVESLKNSISIASLLGTLGGTVVFNRDDALERSEAKETQGFMRDSNEANLRP